MKLAAFSLAALAALGLSSGTASAQHVHGHNHGGVYVQPAVRYIAPPVYSYAPAVGVGIVTPGGFSFGYSNVRPAYGYPAYGYSSYGHYPVPHHHGHYQPVPSHHGHHR